MGVEAGHNLQCVKGTGRRTGRPCVQPLPSQHQEAVSAVCPILCTFLTDHRCILYMILFDCCRVRSLPSLVRTVS